MRSTLFATAALCAAALAFPAMAQTTQNIGYVGAAVGVVEVDDESEQLYAVEAATVLPVSGSLGLQLDVSYLGVDFEDLGRVNTLGGRAHLFTRNEAFLLGGFVAATRTSFEDSTPIESDSVSGYALGVEGQSYLGPVTLGAALSWAVGDEEDDEEGFAVEGEARYFVSPDFSVEAGVGYADADDDGATTLSLGAEYKFGASPFSLRAEFANADLDGLDSQTFLIGLRVNGAGTLLDRDRRGPSL
jgi:hypothetical protein